MKTTSLELSKRIATLEGDKGESEYWWFPHREMETHRLIEWKIKDTRCGSNESVPALTTDELLERLPVRVVLGKKKNYVDGKQMYFCNFEGKLKHQELGESPAEALGLLYEHLLSKGLIT